MIDHIFWWHKNQNLNNQSFASSLFKQNKIKPHQIDVKTKSKNKFRKKCVTSKTYQKKSTQRKNKIFVIKLKYIYKKKKWMKINCLMALSKYN